MKITYLIRNDEVKDRFADKKLPDGVARGTVGTYEAEGGRLFLLSFTVDGSTIAGAQKLAKLRDELQDDTSTRLLVDDASLKFARALFPRFAKYERKLRYAITLATCAKHDNFDDPLVKSLEKLPLGKLGKQLFYGKSFQDKIGNRTKDLFTKDKVTEPLSQSDETTVWSALFGDEALSSVRENYESLCKMRNKVMHQRLITERDYNCACEMLRTSIGELDAYIEKVRSDVSYPKRHADRAANAAKLIRDNSTALQQAISDEATRFLGELASSSTTALLTDIDTEATAALSTIAALSSLGQMDSSSTDGSDNDLGDVSDDDGKTGSDEK